MDKVYLSTIRDIWFNKTRSIVVILALITVVCFPIAFLNVAPNLTTVIDNEQDTYHLAHYNIFFDTFYDTSVNDTIGQHIEDYGIDPSQFVVESKILEGSKIRSMGGGEIPEGSWIDLDIQAVDPDNPPYVSALELVEGSFADTNQEVVLLDSLAEADGLEIGDIITLFQRGGDVQYRISGFAKSIEYSSYELSQTGVAFLSIPGMERLTNRAGLENLTNEVSIYFEFDISDQELIDLSDYLKEKISEDEINAVLFWFVRETSFRKALLDGLNLTSEYMTAASVFIFLVAGVVIFVVTNRYITEQKRRIGALYSFGVRRRQIMLSFFFRMLLLSIVAIILGLLIAKQLLGGIVSELVDQWGLIGYSDDINTESVIFTLTSAAIVSYLFTFLAVINLIKLTPYEAMRGKTAELKNRGIFFKISNQLPSRIFRSAAKNLTRNRTRTVLTVVAFTIALTFSGSLLYTDQSIGTTIDNFYDERVNFDVEVELGYNTIGIPNSQVVDSIVSSPEVSRSEYYINNLVQLSDRPDVLTYLIGLYRNTSMYDMSEGNLLEGRWHSQNSSEVVISRYLQGTIGLNVGEQLDFEFFGMRFNTTIVGISNDILYSTAFLIDFDYLNHIISEEIFQGLNQAPVANKLLLQLDDGVSVEEFQDDLNTNNRDVIIALTLDTYERRSLALSESQTAIIYLMVGLGLVVGVVSVFTTLLIAIVERERELALLQVFGYKKKELFFQVLIEGWIIGIIAFIPTLFAARIVSEHLWNTIISQNIYQIFPVYTLDISIFLGIFTLLSILISIIPAFLTAVKPKLSETIREE